MYQHLEIELDEYVFIPEFDMFTKEKVPVYAGNFVVADYGAGMVMAVQPDATEESSEE